MNVILVDVEDKIKAFFEKKSNEGKKYTLLEIAKIIDPKNKISYFTFEIVLRKMEIEGLLYYDKESGTYESFPYELGFVQCSLLKNNSGEGLIDMPDGRKFKLEGREADTLLSGDLIIVTPTNKRSGNRMIATFNKIVKRRNGLVVVEVVKTEEGTSLVPVSTKLGYPIILDDNDVSDYHAHDLLLVKIDDLSTTGVFEAELIKAVNLNEETIDKLVSSKEYDEEYVMNDYLDNSKNMALELQEEDYTVKGIMRINKYGEGLVTVKNGTTYLIKPEHFNDAFKGDLVEIRPSKLKSHGHIVSKVESVLKRNDGLLTIEISHNKKGEIVLNPLNYVLKHPVVLPKNFDKSFVDGDRFVGKIGTSIVHGHYEVEYIRSLGHKDDPDADLRLIAAEHDIVEPFTEEQLKEAYSLPTEVLPEERIGRTDYTKRRVFSIDGKKTKDRDDAVSIEPLPNGNYLVGVHISDVPHYIKPGMHLWNAITERCTSVYMDEAVISMLPHIISNGICSLNPNVDRLTFNIMMEMDEYGHIINFDFIDGIIKSEKAMNYDDVNEILEEDKVPKGYEPYVDDLNKLNVVALGFAKWLESQGMISFDDVESDIEVERDENGKIIEFKTVKQRSAQRLIEFLMLAAGYCGGLYTMFPTTYRVEEAPDEIAVNIALQKIRRMGVKVVKTEDVTDRKFLQRVIQAAKSQPLRTAVANQILLAMRPARIDVDSEIGHYVLGFRMVRLTSPIRRAEDDIAINQIRKQRDCLYNPDDIQEVVDTDYEWIGKQSKLISLKQDNADQAEKDAVLLRMMKYIDDHLGEQFPAIVTYVNKGGIFIKTSNGVVGKIDINDYQGDILLFDENRLAYRGRNTGIRIKIGTTLMVTALDAHREYKMINFGVTYEDAKKLVLKKGV